MLIGMAVVGFWPLITRGLRLAKKKRSKNRKGQGKKKYRVFNWRTYNRALVNRGNISLWISPEIAQAWHPQGVARERGGQKKYSDEAIEIALSLRIILSLTLRATEGFLQGLAELANLDIPIPCYTTLSRRGKNLDVAPLKQATGEPVYLIVDSTGLKVYGEGEWLKEKHKAKGRKTWRKLHIGVDDSGYIQAAELTPRSTDDAQAVPLLLDQIERSIDVFCGDGAYDRASVYQALEKHNGGIQPEFLVPPRKDAAISASGGTQRDKHIAFIKEHGRSKWYKRQGYTTQSRVENTMYRYKTIIGGKLRARDFSNQQTESKIGVKMLNWMTSQGMPVSASVP